jgi:HEAT repeat protein
VPELIAALQDNDRLLARLAGDALIAIGEPAVEALLAVFRDGDLPPRLDAARALALIGDRRAIPALFEALDGDSSLIAYWAETGLERMGVGMVFFQP